MAGFAKKFESATVEWPTPQDLFDKLDAEFGFTTDVAATPDNAKCKHYYTQEQDGLKQTWRGVCWMNPPYGRAMVDWLKKSYPRNMERDNDRLPDTSADKYDLVA